MLIYKKIFFKNFIIYKKGGEDGCGYKKYRREDFKKIGKKVFREF